MDRPTFEFDREKLKEMSSGALRSLPVIVVLAGEKAGAQFPIFGDMVVGREDDCEIYLPDLGVSRKHLRLSVQGERVVAVDLQSTNGIHVRGQKVESTYLEDGDQLVLAPDTVLLFRRFDPTQQASTRDPETGLYTEALFKEFLTAEWSVSLRFKSDVSVLVVKMDPLANVEDEVAHAVFLQLAEILRGLARVEDSLARLQGHRFALLLRGKGVKDAQSLCTRIRNAIDEVEWGAPVSVSQGIASRFESIAATEEDLLSFAQEAAEKAQAAGGNQVQVY